MDQLVPWPLRSVKVRMQPEPGDPIGPATLQPSRFRENRSSNRTDLPDGRVGR